MIFEKLTTQYISGSQPEVREKFQRGIRKIQVLSDTDQYLRLKTIRGYVITKRLGTAAL